MPELRRYNPTWLSTVPVAHRGLHSSGVPENSLAAFKAAAAAGYAIELDVRLSSDRQLVVIHDANTRRITRHNLAVANTPAATLTQLHLLGTRQSVPLLVDVLKTIRGLVPVDIEVKTGTSAKLVGPRLVNLLANYRGEVAVSSFDPRILMWLRRHARHIPRVQIASMLPAHPSYPHWVRRLLRTMPLNWIVQPHAIKFDIRDYPTAAVTFWEHVLSVPVLLWVVKSRRQLVTADRDACNIIFERLRPPLRRH